MSTYTILTGAKTVAGSIRNWSNVGDVDSDTILGEAQQWIYRRLRVREMIPVPTTGVFVIGQDYLSLPTSYLACITFRITGINAAKVEKKTIDFVEAQYSYDGSGTRVNAKPRFFFPDETRFNFDSPADQAYPYSTRCFIQPDDLSSSNTSNFLSTKGIRALRATCMAFTAEFRKDDSRERWLAVAQAEIDEMNVEGDLDEVSDMGVEIV